MCPAVIIGADWRMLCICGTDGLWDAQIVYVKQSITCFEYT